MTNLNKKQNLETVTLDLDDGRQMVCDVISIFPVNIHNKEQMYIALLDQKATEDDDIFLYRVSNLDDIDNIVIDDIEDDDEFDAVADAFDEMLDDEELNEMLDDLDDEIDEED